MAGTLTKEQILDGIAELSVIRDLVALTRPDDGRPVRQADQRDGQQISVRRGL